MQNHCMGGAGAPLPPVGGAGGGRFGRQNASMSRSRQSVKCGVETECVHGYHSPGGVEELGKENQALPPGSGLSPTHISGSCHSALRVPVSLLHGCGFGNVFCRV